MIEIKFNGKKYKDATGDIQIPVTPAVVQPNWFQRNQKVIIIGGMVVIAALLFVPDVYIRKYLPWVK
jgi:hypothetical protein